MFAMRFFKVIRRQGEVEFTLSQIIFLFPIFQLCQFQLEMPQIVFQVNQLKAAVCRGMFACDMQAQCFFIKFQRPLHVQNIEVKMIKRKFHIFCRELAVERRRRAGFSCRSFPFA